jgi:hypothetical protein
MAGSAYIEGMKIALNQLVADSLSYIPDEPTFYGRIVDACVTASDQRRKLAGFSGPTALDIFHLTMDDFRKLFGDRHPDSLNADERVSFYELLRS